MSENEQFLVESKGLDWVSPKNVKRNPHNPRLIFEEKSLEILKDSIKKVGILVPLLVYLRKKDNTYILLDGERRWRSSLDLELEKIPVNIIAEPNLLTNILTMFNIHNVREKWDPMPTALKLEVLMRLLKTRDNKKLAVHTGLTAAYVARCKRLLTYDKSYQDMMILGSEDDRIKADFFIELYPVLGSIERDFPEISKEYNRETIINIFIDKYQRRVITNVLDFRVLIKILRAIKKGVQHQKISDLIKRLLSDSNFSIKEAYEESVRSVYNNIAIEKVCTNLIDSLHGLKNQDVVDSLVERLKDLRQSIDKLLQNFE